MNRTMLRPLLALALPVLAMLYFWLSNHLVASGGHRLILKVDGYDPRDLVAGFYLRYTVDYGLASGCDKAPEQQELCACFDSTTAPLHKATAFIPCSSRKAESCPVYIRGRCKNSRLVAGIERYYIPEKSRHVVPVIPEGSTITVRTSDEGNAVVTGFEVAGQPLLEYLEEHTTGETESSVSPED